MTPVALASASASRAAILSAAGLAFEVVPSRVDEEALKAPLLAGGASPRQIAEALAETKALGVQGRDGVVIGADQTLDLDGALMNKAGSIDEARSHLQRLRGRKHQLHTAVVLARNGKLVWRTTETATLAVRAFSHGFLEGYLARNGEAALSSVGCYHLEAEGAQLFEHVEGDYFSILGLPLVGLLGALRREGAAPC
jgi:septum formation protein